MILTITLNPALDRTVCIDDTLHPLEINHALSSYIEPGGRGINIARAIKALGGHSMVLGFSAGTNGRFMKDFLTSLDIQHYFVDVPGNTRMNLKIIDKNGETTDVNEPGFTIYEGDFLRLLERVNEFADQENIFVLSGSPPPDFSVVNFGKICKPIRKANARLIVDATGAYLRESLKYEPDYVRVTPSALAELTDSTLTLDPEQLAVHAKTVLELGARCVCITIPHNGAVFARRDDNEILYVTSTNKMIDAGAIGTSAALMGAMAEYSWRGMDFIEMAKISVASAYASAQLPGTEMASLKRVYEAFENILVYVI